MAIVDDSIESSMSVRSVSWISGAEVVSVLLQENNNCHCSHNDSNERVEVSLREPVLLSTSY